MQPTPGTVEDIAPGVRVLLAPNPGVMTHWGTNCYLLGTREICIIDPGPNDLAHINALIHAARPGRISHILVTHAHADHSGAAHRLSARTGAPIYAYGPADAGRRPIMEALATAGHLGGGEGVDNSFLPDIQLADGDKIANEEWSLDVLHLPGHFAGHLGFRYGDLMFSGDHVMDWSTTMVSPPDGHLGDFMQSCQRLVEVAPKTCLTGHGAPIHDATERLNWLMSHRRERESQLRGVLQAGPSTIEDIVLEMYRDVPRHLHRAAARNVLAHIIDLAERWIIEATPELHAEAVFRLR